MTNDINDGIGENIQKIGMVSTAGIPFGMKLANGKIRVSDTPYGYDVAEGNITNHEAFFRIGYVGLVGTTYTDMYPGGSTTPLIDIPPSSGRGFGIQTGSTLDRSSNGTGIKSVVVDYLDTSFTTQTTTLTLVDSAGGLPVAMSAAINMLRVNSVRADTVGTLGYAKGTVIVGGTSANSTFHYREIAAGETRARTAIFTVPEGKCLYIDAVECGISPAITSTANNYVRMKLVANQAMTGTTETFFLPFWENIVANTYSQELNFPMKFYGHVDVKMVALSNQSSGVATNVTMRGWLETA